MKIVISCFVLWFLSHSNSSNAQWLKLNDFPGDARDDGILFAVNGRLYGGFGLDAGFQLKNDIWEYNPEDQQWQFVNHAPLSQRQYLLGLVMHQKAYLLGGIGSQHKVQSDLWVFDGSLWKQLADAPAAVSMGVIFPLPDGSGFVAGLGQNANNECSDSLFSYHFDTNKWRFFGTVPGGGRCLSLCAATYHNVVIAYGMKSNTDVKTDAWEYSWKNNSWTAYQNDLMPTPGKHFLNLSQGSNKALCGFGENASGEVSDEVYLYESAGNTWQILGESSPARRGASWAMLHDDLYLIWGLNENFQRQIAHWVKSVDLKTSLLLFPNPATNDLNVYFNDWGGTSWQFELIDMQGRSVDQFIIMEGQLNKINVNTLPKGIYFLRCPEKAVVVKWIKS